jgi:triacylglycerol esterase/lipase EstA (alpha/beta hydrolase family)
MPRFAPPFFAALHVYVRREERTGEYPPEAVPNRTRVADSNLMKPSFTIAALLACALLTGCTQYASVSEKKPQFRPVRSTLGALAGVEPGIVKALTTQHREPLAALGEYLAAAETAAAQLARNPHDEAALEAYNFAVARVFSTLRDAKIDPWTQPLRVPSAGGDFVLTHKGDKRKNWNPALYEFIPADQFDVKGTYVRENTIKPGLGAPLVAVGKKVRDDAKAEFAESKAYYGITAVARFEKRRVVIAFEDPLATETTMLAGHSYPLGANFTVPIAVMLAQQNPKKLELARVLRPGKYAETAKIVRLQPYDPKKTVVIVTHGLKDSPATWAPMLNALRGDPVIRERFQFWFYSYPSGYPYPYSAAIMREQLDAIEKRFPLQKKVVLIGHSMGSSISRLMITDSGDKLWLNVFGKPPEEVPLTGQSRKTLEEALIFRHRPEVGRVIFISGPHRGSELATNWIGRFSSSLVKAPNTLLKVGEDMRKVITLDTSSLHLKRIPNSVDTLAPNNRFVKAINTVPLTPGIPYHSIMGDRGKGGNKDHTKPVSSDGVVPYWSSHLDGAQSELIVPSNHAAHQNSKAIAEVRRILRLHAGVSTKD